MKLISDYIVSEIEKKKHNKQIKYTVAFLLCGVVLLLMFACAIGVSAVDYGYYEGDVCNRPIGNASYCGGIMCYSGVVDYNGETHTNLYQCDSCDAFYTDYVSHNMMWESTSEYDDEKHETKFVCDCGYYYYVFNGHSWSYYGDFAYYDDTYHSFFEYCICGHKTYGGLADHSFANGICSVCDYNFPTSFKGALNTITTGKGTTTVGKTYKCTYYSYNDTITTTDEGNLTVSGWLAMNGGVDKYTVTITSSSGATSYDVVNITSDKLFDSAMHNNIATSGYDITDYDSNGCYLLTINLAKYGGQSVVVSFSATSNRGQNEMIMLFADVNVPENDLATDTETETETEAETDTEIETELETDIITPDISDKGSYDKGYLDGYNQAINDTSYGVFENAIVSVTCKITDKNTESLTQYIESFQAPLCDYKNGINFRSIWDFMVSNGWTDETKYIIDYITISVTCDQTFKWHNDMLWFTTYDILDDVIPKLEVFTLDDDIMEAELYFKNNRYYWNIPYTSDIHCTSFRFTIKAIAEELDDIINRNQLTLYNNAFQLGYDINSYNQGYDEGYNEALQKGTELGKVIGYKEGYNVGYSDGYKDDNDLYTVITAPIDAIQKVFYDIFNFEILGVNLLAFLSSILTILLIAWIIKKVI